MTGTTQPAAVLDGGVHPPAPENALCRQYDLALLDLDGVVYRGPHAVPAAPPALATARASGMRLAFVTNNASRSAEQIVGQLTGLGIAADADEVVTSAQAAATLAVTRLGVDARVFVVGGDGLRRALTDAGLAVVERYDASPPPQAVVQGFSPDLTYEDLAQGALAVAAGADWIATNTDSTLPTARGLQPGNGTLVAAVAAATGRRPVVAGKPERAIIDEAVRRAGGTRPLVVGDRLDTDIEGAVRAGLDSLLVLTGVSTLADLLTAAPEQRPTFLAADVSGLASEGVPLTPSATQARGWQVSRAPSGWQLRQADAAAASGGAPTSEAATLGHATDGAAPRRLSDGQLLDAIRSVVVASWQAVDAGESLQSIMAPAALVGRLVALGLPSELLRPCDDEADGGTVQKGSDHG